MAHFRSGLPPLLLVVTAGLIAALGVALFGGGVWLGLMGGSWYYAIAGSIHLAVAALTWCRSPWAIRLYWAMLAATIVWALLEVGLQPWLLLPRVAMVLLIALWLVTPWMSRSMGRLASRNRRAKWSWSAKLATIGVVVIAIGAAVFSRPSDVTSSVRLPVSLPLHEGWAQVGKDLTGTRYSPAAQITAQNVVSLQEAWRFNIGKIMSTLEATPIVADGSLVFCSADNVIIALDPDTGAQRWRFEPNTDSGGRMHLACRGVAQYSTGIESEVCATRIYTATIDARLIALDARTGLPCEGFGTEGTVSLMEGIGAQPRGFYYTTSPPLVTQGMVIVGAYVMDNQRVNAPSGVVRAFDATTGALRWAWDMGQPRKGLPDTGQTYTPGTPNVWGIMSADTELGLVYLPLGNPAPDFWGGHRREYDERFGSAIVALRIETGEVAWSFQTTHHDLWDYDLPAQPVLVDLAVSGQRHKAVVVPTKRGDLFVLDRANGTPIYPITERPVPQGAAQGDHVSPSQPYSAVTLAPQPLSEKDMWGMTTLDQMVCRIRFRQLRYEGDFTPPNVTPSLKYPGAFGVIDWGGVTIDEERMVLVANTSYMASIDRLIPRERAPGFARQVTDARLYEWGPQEGTPFVINTEFFLSRARVPCTAPPWGRMNAIDLNTGKLLWSRPLGRAENSGPFNIRSRLPFEMGVPNTGGAITTRGGVAFVGASVDHYLRAFNTETGQELWRSRLPAPAHATPMTFVSSKTGRQYVVVAAGGHASMSPHLSDAVMAYALPIESSDRDASTH